VTFAWLQNLHAFFTSVNEAAANLAEASKSGGPLHRAWKPLLT